MSILAIASKMVVRYSTLPLSEKRMLHWLFFASSFDDLYHNYASRFEGNTVLYMYNSTLNTALQYSKLLSWLHVSGLQLGSAH